MGLPIIRVRFHATGPDGRQAGPVDVPHDAAPALDRLGLVAGAMGYLHL